jgi:hypothetical protein
MNTQSIAAGNAIKRTLLVSLIVLVGVNIWTGGPLLALWIGGEVQRVLGNPSPGSGETVAGVIGVLASLIVIEYLLYVALTRLGRAHDTLIGKPPRARQHAPWHRSVDESDLPPVAAEREPLSTVERVMIAMLVVCVIAVEILFFFFTHTHLAPGSP